MKLPQFVFAAVLLPLLGSSLQAAQPGEVKAFFRAGQTFITWKENGQDQYFVYRSDKPITDVKNAKLIATVAVGSSLFPLEQRKGGHYLEQVSGKKGYGQRYVIEDNPDCDPAKMLADDTGLYVHTAHEKGSFYYAVTDSTNAIGQGNSLAKPIEEKEEPAGTVLVYRKKVDGGEHRIYTHWMDESDFNPKPTGGCAFNFGLAVPDGDAPGVVLRLHAYGCRYEVYGPLAGMLTIVTDDPQWSWYYGYRDAEGKQVVNYTERRIMQTVDLALRIAKAEGHKVDASRTYIHGGSMGGSGANLFALMHGKVFAAVSTHKGMVNYNFSEDMAQLAEKGLWGLRSDNLSTNLKDRAWEHLNLTKWCLDNVGKETAFIMDTHASDDKIILFPAAIEYYEALQKAKRPFVALWGTGGHSAQLDLGKWPNYPKWPCPAISTAESVPAIGYASSSDKPAAGGKGQINLKIEWCSSFNDFDKKSAKDDIVDLPDRWEMCIRSLEGEQTASITPRRCQKFKAAAGKKYHWENWSFADPAKPAKAAEGTAAADEFGLVTVEKFAFGKAGWGNRLVIFPEK